MSRRAALAEFRTLGALAAPIVVTQFSQMGMGVADAAMAGQVSATDLAGVTLGGNLYWPLMLLMSGIVMAVTPSVSQLHGGGRVSEAGALVRQALWIAVVGGAALVVLLHNVEPVYRAIGVDERAIPVAVAYLRAASLGLPPLLAYVALRCLCEGMTWTKPAMFISLSALAAKVPLNWLFIHGSEALGVPAMGGVGCGWATAIVMTCTLAAMVAVASLSRVRASNVFSAFSLPDPRAIGSLLRLGVPIGLTLFLEVAFFSVVTLLVGRLGVETVAAHQIAFNIVGVAFMAPLALGMAATIRVGFNVGAGDAAAARTSAWVAVATTITWGVCMAALIATFRHTFVGFYGSESEVLEPAAALLLLGALFQVFDAGQVTTLGALRGYKDTRAPMVIAVVSYWIVGLPVGAALCFGLDLPLLADALDIDWLPLPSRFDWLPQLGVQGFWWGLVAGLAVVALALFARLARISRDPAKVARLA